MLSSTSSFERYVPDRGHTRKLLIGLLGGLLLVLLFENLFRTLGVTPNVRETASLWAIQREFAAAPGAEKLILVGASRSQLGVDIEELERLSNKPVVQLAIDGSPYLNVLEHLADDQSVHGTIIIATTLDRLISTPGLSRSDQWIDEYETNYRDRGYLKIENNLVAMLQSASALYANVVPLPAVFSAIIRGNALPPSYIVTQTNRERNADYNLTTYPDIYIARVMRTLDLPLPPREFDDLDQFETAILNVARANLEVAEIDDFDLAMVQTSLTKLRQRGVEVVFVQFPMSGAVEAINNLRYPKVLWDSVMSELDARAIDYRDFPRLDYELVDGSHLDIRQKTEFTRNLFQILERQVSLRE
ncbi:MAG: hypothetical protein IIB72_12300 [Proteobacteria bacterium]|nr:hypothetical protein [Pseudomonadota bacterium]